jgi:hypothetical protein
LNAIVFCAVVGQVKLAVEARGFNNSFEGFTHHEIIPWTGAQELDRLVVSQTHIPGWVVGVENVAA